jgi:hypothetical protein
MISSGRRYGAATTEVVISPESWRGAAPLPYRQRGLDVRRLSQIAGAQRPQVLPAV